MDTGYSLGFESVERRASQQSASNEDESENHSSVEDLVGIVGDIFFASWDSLNHTHSKSTRHIGQRLDEQG